MKKIILLTGILTLISAAPAFARVQNLPCDSSDTLEQILKKQEYMERALEQLSQRAATASEDELPYIRSEQGALETEVIKCMALSNSL